MLNTSSKVQANLPIDAVIALAIVLVNVVPYTWHLATFQQLRFVSVGLIDAIFAIAFLFAWTLCFARYELYNKLATIPSRFVRIVKGVLIMTFFVVIYIRWFHHRWMSLYSLLLMVIFLLVYEVDRIAVRFYFLDWLAARDPRRAVIIGSGPRASKAWREVRTRYHSSIRLVGFVDDRTTALMPPDVAGRYCGTLQDLTELLKTTVIDMFMIAMPAQSCYPQMQEAIRIAETVGAEVVYLNDIYISRSSTKSYTQTIFQELQPKQDKYLRHLAMKRILDVTISSFGLVLLSPIFAAIAIAIKLSGGGSVIFSQRRIGHHRRPFTIYKFRSMVTEAESMISGLEHANEMPGPAFKMKNDPRVTRLGALLRATSLDELPQLWNILKGEMSLVGPRPMSVRDVELFDELPLMRRFSVKPGLTGLWQVTGRSRTTFAQWMELDSRYIDEWSLLLDLRILLRTVIVVLNRSGAM